MEIRVKGFNPRPSQKAVLKSQARFLIIDAGRRWGKTITALNWILWMAFNRGGENWWVAPVYSQSKMAFRRLLSAARRGGADKIFFDVSQSELRIKFISGAALQFKSADNPDTLRGEGLTSVVIDEAARVKREVWEEVIRPAVSDTGGRVMFISTPKGKNWFFDLWTRGQDPMQKEKYESWQFPTHDNPKIPQEEIDLARNTLPADVFRQEYLAEFLESEAVVFRNVSNCMGAKEEPPIPGKSYFAGCDLAKHTDYTVLSILDSEGNQVYFTRLQKLDWPYQKKLISEIVRRYNNARLVIDSTGVGDPIFDDLCAAGLNVEGFKFTQENKKKLIETLMLSFEQEKIKILNNPVQLNELQIFEYNISPSGIVHYSAPEGYHDDCVIALALANWAWIHRTNIFIWRA